jgi:hypothetical protein
MLLSLLLPSTIVSVISAAEAVPGRSVLAAVIADPVIAMLRNSLRVFISSSFLSVLTGFRDLQMFYFFEAPRSAKLEHDAAPASLSIT